MFAIPSITKVTLTSAEEDDRLTRFWTAYVPVHGGGGRKNGDEDGVYVSDRNDWGFIWCREGSPLYAAASHIPVQSLHRPQLFLDAAAALYSRKHRPSIAQSHDFGWRSCLCSGKGGKLFPCSCQSCLLFLIFLVVFVLALVTFNWEGRRLSILIPHIRLDLSQF